LGETGHRPGARHEHHLHPARTCAAPVARR
jgi:hypothetical protein